MSEKYEELENGGFKFTLNRNPITIIITMEVDALNNIEISVGRIENSFDYQIIIPAGLKEYLGAKEYFNAIYCGVFKKGIYKKEDIDFLDSALLREPRIISRLDAAIRNMPEDIYSAAEKRINESLDAANQRILLIQKESAVEIEKFVLLREGTLKLAEVAKGYAYLVRQTENEPKPKGKI